MGKRGAQQDIGVDRGAAASHACRQGLSVFAVEVSADTATAQHPPEREKHSSYLLSASPPRHVGSVPGQGHRSYPGPWSALHRSSD